MYTLANSSLSVQIIDPVADLSRLGTRYCTGGYIFQIADARVGDLLSGPTYPDDFNTYDGQGIPDAFRLAPIHDSGGGERSLVIGVGLCNLRADTVLQFCEWRVVAEETRICMCTEQSFGDASFELDRTVSLLGRTVRSETRLRNVGQRPLPFRWFPHPFFPHPDGDELCRFNLPVSFSPSSAYDIAESGFIRRRGWPWTEGHYQSLDFSGTGNLVVLQKHPKLGIVGANCSYIPTYLPIWGNPSTFSWEPFLEATVGSLQQKCWCIDYDF